MLSPAFGGMTAFIKETEPLLERGQGQVIRPDERMYTLLAQLRSLLLVIYLAMLVYVFIFIKLTTSNKPFKSKFESCAVKFTMFKGNEKDS